MKPLARPLQSLLQPFAMSAVLLLAGCASDAEPYPATFGDSVRHMIAVQTANPSSGAMGLDGDKAEAVLSAYRGDVAKPEPLEETINIHFQ